MRIAVPLLALLLIGALPAGAVGGSVAASAPDPASDAGASEATLPQRTANLSAPLVTEIRLIPDPNGDARWRITVRYALESDAEREAFQRYGQDFERGDAGVGLDVKFFRALASEASRTTGREMEIRDPVRNATVDNGTGTLRLSFTWTNFVTQTQGGFAVQDAVLMPNDRTWLSSIGPSQRLVIETPPGYRVSDTRFGLDNGSVVIDGPHTFEDPLTVAYRQSTPENGGNDPPWTLVGAALLGAVALAAAYVYRRDGDAGAAATVDDGEPASATDAPNAGDDGGTVADDSEPPAGAGAGAAAAAEDDEEDVDLSLLSDEERVERLLDRNGGRMKQARIVDETGWSDAKVSQLLTSMAEEGRVEKLRLGRENLISLPDEEP